MNRWPFDAWMKRLPGGAADVLRRSTSRRHVLGGVTGSVAALAAGRLAEDDADAAGQGICGAGCGTLCEPVPALLRCNFTNGNCACLKSTSGVIHCAESTSACPPPGAPDDCQTDRDCVQQGLGDICVRTAGGVCCSDSATEAQVNLCMRSCLNLTTASRSRPGASLLAGVGGRL